MTPMPAATPSNGVATGADINVDINIAIDIDHSDKIPARRFFVKLP